MSWFDYLAEPEKLDREIASLSENKKLQLIKEFVYEATQYERRKETNYDVSETFTDHLQKSYILYTLALKCFASIRYNLNLIHKWEMPICIVGNLLRQFVKITTGNPDVNPLKEVDWNGWNDGASRFSQILYMCWTLLEGLDRVLVKPAKRCLTPPLPGLTTVPNSVFVPENNLEEEEIHRRLEGCANILNCTVENSENVYFSVPSLNSFTISRDTESTQIPVPLKHCTQVSTDGMIANVRFFLGRHCFQRKEFDKAYQNFKEASQQIDTSLFQICFLGLNRSLLDSYSALCKKMSVKLHQTRFQSDATMLESQIKSIREDGRANADIVANILLEDTLVSTDVNNKPCRVSEPLRRRTETCIRQWKGSGWYRVSVAAILHRVVQGRAPLSQFLTDLSDLEPDDVVLAIQDTMTQVCKILAEVKKDCAVYDNVKCFLMFLAHNLPPSYRFTNTLLSHSDLTRVLDEFELECMEMLSDYSEMDVVTYDINSNFENYQQLENDWFSMYHTSDSLSLSSNGRNVSRANVEPTGGLGYGREEVEMARLLHSYDCEEIKDVLMGLRRGKEGVFWNRKWLGHVCDDYWELPVELEDILESIGSHGHTTHSLGSPGPDFEAAFIFILVTKAGLLRDKMHSWDLARQLLETARSRVHNNASVFLATSSANSTNNKVALLRILDLEILHCDLIKLLVTWEPTNCRNKSHIIDDTKTSQELELYTRAKSALSSILPIYLQISCICTLLLLSTDPFSDLTTSSLAPRNQNPRNTPVTQLARLLCTVVKDCQVICAPVASKFIKSARDLFDMLLVHVTDLGSESATGSSSGTAASSPLLSWNELLLFTHLLASPQHLDMLISAFVSILSCLRSDINLSRPPYPRDMWPSTISQFVTNDSGESESVIVSRLSELVHDTLHHALALNPFHSHWLFVRADLAMADGDWFTALKTYLEAGAAETDFFTRPLSNSGPSNGPVYTEWAVQQMIRASRESGYLFQAVFLCQYLTVVADSSNHDNYTAAVSLAAQIASSSTISMDTCDVLVHLVWLPDMLEILAGMYHNEGAVDAHKRCIDVLATQPSMNSNNEPELVSDAASRKQLEFLRLTFMKYSLK